MKNYSLEQKRKAKLGYTSYKPWDTAVDVDGLAPLKPFEGGTELTDLSVECLRKLRPYFGESLATMKAMKHLDLESKNGKAPGGFMYPLYEIGVPFIYMNAVGSQRDVVTMVHEGGHAVHSFLSRDIAITENKSTPSEIAELEYLWLRPDIDVKKSWSQHRSLRGTTGNFAAFGVFISYLHSLCTITEI